MPRGVRPLVTALKSHKYWRRRVGNEVIDRGRVRDVWNVLYCTPTVQVEDGPTCRAKVPDTPRSDRNVTWRGSRQFSSRTANHHRGHGSTRLLFLSSCRINRTFSSCISSREKHANKRRIDAFPAASVPSDTLERKGFQAANPCMYCTYLATTYALCGRCSTYTDLQK